MARHIWRLRSQDIVLLFKIATIACCAAGFWLTSQQMWDNYQVGSLMQSYDKDFHRN